MVKDHVDRGALSRVLPSWSSPMEALYIYFPPPSSIRSAAGVCRFSEKRMQRRSRSAQAGSGLTTSHVGLVRTSAPSPITVDYMLAIVDNPLTEFGIAAL